MQVAFHLGAYSTEVDRLLRLLGANAGLLERERIFIPDPADYRYALRDALVALDGCEASPAIVESLVMTCAGRRADAVNRLILPQGGFLAGPERVIGAEGLYPLAGNRVAALVNLFPDDDVSFHFTLINPALMLSALVQRQTRRSYDDIMAGLAPDQMLWSPVVAQIVAGAQGCPVTVWCNEDLPLILPEATRLLAGLAPEVTLDHEDAMLEQLMTPEGIDRLRAYVTRTPPRSVAQRRKVVAAFLDKYARPERLEADVALPGWTDAVMEAVDAAYERDIARIAALPGVTFVSP